jgi:hypothetical protein
MKISAYDELFDPADGDFLPIVHGGTTYKIQLALIKALSVPASGGGGGGGGLADPGGSGLVARTSLNTTVAVSLVKPTEGFAIINPNGVSGNPTFVLANDLAALEALAGNGYAKRTGPDTWTTVATIPAGDLPGVPFLGFGNPTTPIGLNAVNGSSTSAMRSDAAPALSQSISPTMTGNWTLTQPLVLGVAGSLPGEILLKGSTGGTLIVKAAPAAGDWTFSFPVSAGAPSYFLVTDGAGLTSWIMRTIAAGAGLTGGGDLTADRTIALGLPSSLSASSTNSASGATHSHTIDASIARSAITIAAGVGLTGGGDLTANRTIAMGLPSTLSVASPTSVTGTTHSHAITSSANPGASASILATDANGYLHLTRILADSLGVGTTTPRKLADFLSNSQSQLRLSYTDNSVYTDFTVSSGGTLTVEPTGNFVFNTAGKQIDPQLNYDQNLGQVSKKYLTLWAAELWVETLVAQNTIATIGGRILVGPTTSLIADLAPAAVAINVKHNNLFTGDVVYLESGGKVEFMSITGGPATIAGGFQYNVTRDLDGSGPNQWYAGDAVFNTGQAGNGFIDLYSLRGVKSASQAGPTIVGNVRNSSAYNDWSEYWAIGNLNGLYGYGSNTFGAAFGKYAAGAVHITIDSVNGYQTFSGLLTSVQQIDAAGNIRVGQLAAGQSNVFISAGALDLRLNTTVKIHLDANGSGWLANTNISWDASGNLTVNGNATIAGWSVTPTYINSGTTYIASSFNIPVGNVAWFGKGADGHSGWILQDSSNRRIEASVNVAGGIYPYLAVVDGTYYRVVIGGLNYASFPAGSSDSIGMKIGDAAGNLLAEFSNVRNMIAGWTVAVGYFVKDTGLAATSAGMAPADFPFYAGAIYANRASAPFRVTPAGALFATGATISGAITATSGDITGVLTISSATGALAIGATPPVSSSSGTGLWLDRTGLYALTSGSSRVTINSAGLNIKADGTGYLSFGNTIALIGQESGSNTTFQINVRASATYPTATVIIGADNAPLTQRPALVMTAPPASASYAFFYDSGSGGFPFQGLAIGANVSGTGPAAMLDVRGNASITGNVGIGTTSPQYKLSLGTASDKLGFYSDATHFNTIEFYNASTGGMIFDQNTGAGGGYSWRFAGSPLVSLLGDGSFGIGTITPATRLHVNFGSVIRTGASAGSIELNHNGAARNGLYIDDVNASAGTDVAAVFARGAAVVGSINTSLTGTVFNTTSDARLKENVTESERGLAALLAIQIRDFNFKREPDRRMQGVIAQELFDHYPEAVLVGGDDPQRAPWATDYGRLTPLIIRATQEIHDKIAALEREVAQLRAQLN